MESSSQPTEMAEDVVIVAEFLIDVNNEVFEIHEGQEAEEEDDEVLMKSLENFSLKDHDYTLGTQAQKVK